MTPDNCIVIPRWFPTLLDRINEIIEISEADRIAALNATGFASSRDVEATLFSRNEKLASYRSLPVEAAYVSNYASASREADKHLAKLVRTAPLVCGDYEFPHLDDEALLSILRDKIPYSTSNLHVPCLAYYTSDHTCRSWLPVPEHKVRTAWGVSKGKSAFWLKLGGYFSHSNREVIQYVSGGLLASIICLVITGLAGFVGGSMYAYGIAAFAFAVLMWCIWIDRKSPELHTPVTHTAKWFVPKATRDKIHATEADPRIQITYLEDASLWEVKDSDLKIAIVPHGQAAQVTKHVVVLAYLKNEKTNKTSTYVVDTFAPLSEPEV